MHLLVGFAVLVGLVAFAFGGVAARNLVRTSLLCVAMLLLAAFTYVAVDVWRELYSPAEESAKIPEITPELRRICREWLDHPNDAPRMCFAYLDRAKEVETRK